MRKRIGVIGQVVIGVGLGVLPAITAVSGRMILSGQVDAVAASATATAAKRAETKAEIRVGGAELAHPGVPCRRSAGDPSREMVPKSGMAPKSGCNLRLVKRRPADAMIWV